MSETQQFIKNIQEFAQNIIDTLREPLLVLDLDLRVQSANRAFYHTFQVEAEETMGRRVYNLGDGQWDIFALRRLLEEIIPENTNFNDFLVEHEFPYIGHKTMLLNARRVFRPDNQAELLILAIEDVTERTGDQQRIQQYHIDLELQRQEMKEANTELKKVNAEMERANAEMGKLNTELAALATTDGLTGLHNHRNFQERLATEVSRAARHTTPLSLIMLDVDNFKPYNDTHGHPAGDDVLKAVAHALQECARDTDTVARYGGEEFVLVLPQTDMEGAAAFAERLRIAVESHSWPVESITASFGVAILWQEEGGAELIASADGALYRAKESGRNRVICAPGPTSITGTAPADLPSGAVPSA